MQGAKAGGQQGVALITAIFVIALAIIAASAMMAAANLALHRMNNLQASEQDEWYALGIEAWICSLLSRESATSQRSYTGLGDFWAQPLTELPIDRGLASGHMEDLQGRFNINNLGALNPTPYLNQFERLLEHIPGLDRADIADLGPAIRDWIDMDDEPWAGIGAEDSYYTTLPVPYRTSGLLMRSPSELLSVRGMTPALYEAIHPYIATLPTTSAKININTASLPVLESLSVDSGGQNFGHFIEERKGNPITSLQDLQQRAIFSKSADVGQFIDVRSNYFQLEAVVEVDGVQLTLYSTIYWPTNGMAQVHSHSFGTD